jgi:histidinol-phosphate aminotransferase
MVPLPHCPFRELSKVSSQNDADILSLVQPHLRSAPPYIPVEPPDEVAQRVGLPVERIVKLDANENPYGPSPKAAEALARAKNYHIYPDPEQRSLRKALAAYVGLGPEWVIAGAGSDELIDLLMRLFVAPGKAFLNFPPSFSFYPFLAGVQRADLVEAQRREDHSLDIEAALSAARDANLIVVASPNNPTGNLLTDLELEALLGTGLPVVLDEAYAEFSGTSRVDLVPRHPQLIVLRTFSKWAGLAGLRLGYMVANPALIDLVLRIKQPYNVNVAAAAAAVASFEDLAYLEGNVEALIRERDRMAGMLASLPGVEVSPSRANFVLCRLHGSSAREAHARLLERGILVRYFDTPLLQNHLRISASRPADTDLLVAALGEILMKTKV